MSNVSGASSPNECEHHALVDGSVLRTAKMDMEVVRERKCIKCQRKFETVEMTRDVIELLKKNDIGRLESMAALIIKYHRVLTRVNEAMTIVSEVGDSVMGIEDDVIPKSSEPLTPFVFGDEEE